MRVLEKRLRRLEDEFAPADGKPRERFRIVLQPAGLRTPDLELSTCRRTLWPNGTVHESIVLAPGSNGRELTVDELDAWVAGFSIEEEDGIRCISMPPP